MTLHHSKHHQTYVNNLNTALNSQATAVSSKDIIAQLDLQIAIRFNAGGHINHTLFWENLTPASPVNGQESSYPELAAALKKRWGSLGGFRAKFETALLGIKGSDWGWLVQDEESGYLEITTTKDQDPVLTGKKPLLGIDMWEHAYYLQYLNDKVSYVKGMWEVVNWPIVEKRYKSSLHDAFGALKGLKASI